MFLKVQKRSSAIRFPGCLTAVYKDQNKSELILTREKTLSYHSTGLSLEMHPNT